MINTNAMGTIPLLSIKFLKNTFITLLLLNVVIHVILGLKMAFSIDELKISFVIYSLDQLSTTLISGFVLFHLLIVLALSITIVLIALDDRDGIKLAIFLGLLLTILKIFQLDTVENYKVPFLIELFNAIRGFLIFLLGLLLVFTRL